MYWSLYVNEKSPDDVYRAIGVSLRYVRYSAPQYILDGVYFTEGFEGEILIVHNHIVLTFGS